MSNLKITKARVIDLRFPTSRENIGSDAVNVDPDYSAAPHRDAAFVHVAFGYLTIFASVRNVNLARNSIETMASISRFPRRVTVESRREDGRVNVDSAIAARELPNQQGF